MTERVFGWTNKRRGEKWVDPLGDKVGKVNSDGSIEGTPYKFKRPIKGGTAITKNRALKQINDETLLNPATGEVFNKTKKGTGFWGRKSKMFFKPYYTDEGA